MWQQQHGRRRASKEKYGRSQFPCSRSVTRSNDWFNNFSDGTTMWQSVCPKRSNWIAVINFFFSSSFRPGNLIGANYCTIIHMTLHITHIYRHYYRCTRMPNTARHIGTSAQSTWLNSLFKIFVVVMCITFAWHRHETPLIHLHVCKIVHRVHMPHPVSRQSKDGTNGELNHELWDISQNFDATNKPKKCVIHCAHLYTW